MTVRCYNCARTLHKVYPGDPWVDPSGYSQCDGADFQDDGHKAIGEVIPKPEGYLGI